MKTIKSIIISGMLLVISGGIMTSCSDLLDLSPIDFYGSGSYWTTEHKLPVIWMAFINICVM